MLKLYFIFPGKITNFTTWSKWSHAVFWEYARSRRKGLLPECAPGIWLGHRRIFFWQTTSGSRSARQRTDWQRLHQKKPLWIPWHMQASDSYCCDCYRGLVYILHRLVKASNFIINSGHEKVREALLKIQLEFSRITHLRTWCKLWRADRNAFVLYIQSGGLPGGRGGGMISSFLREANNLIILIFPSSPDTQLGQVKTGRWLNFSIQERTPLASSVQIWLEGARNLSFGSGPGGFPTHRPEAGGGRSNSSPERNCGRSLNGKLPPHKYIISMGYATTFAYAGNLAKAMARFRICLQNGPTSDGSAHCPILAPNTVLLRAWWVLLAMLIHWFAPAD